jgi:hypothetical protein
MKRNRLKRVAVMFDKQNRSEADLCIQEGETRRGAVLSDPVSDVKYYHHNPQCVDWAFEGLLRTPINVQVSVNFYHHFPAILYNRKHETDFLECKRL